MGTLLAGRPAGATRHGDATEAGQRPGAPGARRRGEAGTAGEAPDEGAGPGRVRASGLRHGLAVLRASLPRGNTLDDKTFRQRHDFLCWILALHVPALFALGVWLGFSPAHVALEVTVPAACVLLARLPVNRRLAAFFVTAGLVYSASVLVHLTGGLIEAHFHFFILVGLIALYQDWIPLLWDVIFTVLSHGLGSAIGATLVFNHAAGQNRPWLWAIIHGSAVLAACVAQVILWKQTEDSQHQNIALISEIAAADAERREAMSQLLVNLARRNQSLLNRQLAVIADLEQRERHPDVLEELFRLDHLATRIRRNAESLLVLSGDDPPRRWGKPVPLADVVRAAAAEVEDYRRVDVMVDDHLDVAGRGIADLAHLLAELIENATTFSPPTAGVRVRSHLAPGDPVSFVLSIEDVGVGMSDDEMRAANVILARSPEVDLHRATMLGFHVVARLSQRYGIGVSLAGTPGGGLTALVSLPANLLSERPPGVAPEGPAWAGTDRYQRAAMAWAHAHLGDEHGLAQLDRPPAVGPAAIEAPPPVDVAPRAEARPPAGAGVGDAPDPPAPAGTPDDAVWIPVPIPAPPPKPAWWFASQPGAAPAAPAAAPPAAPLPWHGAGPAPEREEPAPPGAGPRSPAWWAVLVDPGRLPQPGTSRGPLSPPGRPGAPPPPRPEPATRVAPEPGGAGAGSPALARRVPGTHLTPALRRGAGRTGGEAAHPAGGRDPERVRSMLSRFQASQRAGRAAAPRPPGSPREGR